MAESFFQEFSCFCKHEKKGNSPDTALRSYRSSQPEDALQMAEAGINSQVDWKMFPSACTQLRCLDPHSPVTLPGEGIYC